MKKVITALTATAAITTYGLSDDAEASSYKVQSGDTLWKIANQNSVSVSQLKSWNNLSSDMIYVNQTIKTSSSSSESSSSSSSSSSSESTSSSSSTGGTYTVKSGDTLSKIARAHGMNYRTLMNINNISSHIIYPGQKLSVSGSSSSSSESSSSSSASTSTSTTQNVSAPAPTSVSYGTNHYYWGECTWYVFERRQQLGKPVGNNWGNAYDWDDRARSAGYKVNNSPSVGAIMQANAWTNFAWGMGHVAVVERINSDGSIIVSEMNFGGGKGVKAFRTISASQVSGHNFIH